MGEWIGEVEIPPDVAEKIKSKHDVTPDDVREAICWGAADEVGWHDHEVHGRRLLAVGTPYHRSYRIIVVLVPVDRTDGRWRCKTAMPWTG